MFPLGYIFWERSYVEKQWAWGNYVFPLCAHWSLVNLRAKLSRDRSRTTAALRRGAPAALQSTLEFLQEHTCTLSSVTFVMGGLPESVTMMGRW